MNKFIFSLTMAATLVVGGAARAAELTAELIMPGDKVWKGSVTSRDGDWVTFSPLATAGGSGRPIRVGANTIKELVFEVKVDEYLMKKLNEEREYQRIIDSLTRTLAPYQDYGDISWNLTRYEVLLMEMYYKTENFAETLKLAKKIAADDRNERYQEKGRVYTVLALIDSGKVEEAEALLAEYGWDKDLNDESRAAELFVNAKLLAQKKEYSAAMEMVAKIIAFHSQDTEWMRPSEYFCAEMYVELGATNPIMYDSAEEVIKQIKMLYKNSNEDDKASKLKIRLDQLRAEQALKESQSEDV